MIDALDRGDLPTIFGWARITWRIMYQIMWWTYEFARLVIDNIIGLIP